VIRASEAIAFKADIFHMICLRRKGEPARELRNGVTIIRFPFGKYRGANKLEYLLHYLRFIVISFFAVSLMHIRYRYDIIHVHNMPEALVFSCIFPRMLGARIVLDMHDLMPETFATKFAANGFAPRILKVIERISIGFADRVIGVHEIGSEILIRRGVNPGKITNVLNVPDPSLFTHKVNGPRDSRFMLIYHGIVAERQGIDVLLLSMKMLISQGLGIYLRLIGEGDYMPVIRRLVSGLGIDPFVEITEPYIPAHEIPNELAKATVGVIPYRRSISTDLMLPVKMIEYIYAGLPVICSRLRAIEHYFDADMVYYVTPGDVESLAEAIRLFYISRDLCSRYGEAAKRFIEKHNWPKERNKLLAVYDDLCQR